LRFHHCELFSLYEIYLFLCSPSQKCVWDGGGFYANMTIDETPWGRVSFTFKTPWATFLPSLCTTI